MNERGVLFKTSTCMWTVFGNKVLHGIKCCSLKDTSWFTVLFMSEVKVHWQAKWAIVEEHDKNSCFQWSVLLKKKYHTSLGKCYVEWKIPENLQSLNISLPTSHCNVP